MAPAFATGDKRKLVGRILQSSDKGTISYADRFTYMSLRRQMPCGHCLIALALYERFLLAA